MSTESPSMTSIPPTSAPPSRPQRTIGQTLWRLFDNFVLAPFRDSLLDWADLPTHQRIVAILGYTLFAALVFATLGLDIWGRRLLAFTFGAGQTTQQISWAAVIISSAGWALGWAYLFVGTAHTQLRWVGLLLVGFALQIVSLADETAPLADIVGMVVLSGLVGGLLVWLARREWLPRWPAGSVLAVAALLGLGAGLFWLTKTPSQRALLAYHNYTLLFWLTEPVWVLGGLATVKFGLKFGQALVIRLRDTLPERGLRWFCALLLLFQPAVSAAAAFPLLLFIGDGSSLEALRYLRALVEVVWYDAWLSGGLGLVVLVLLALRRWSARNAALLLSIRLSFLVYALTFTVFNLSQLDLSNPFYEVVGRLNVLPPSFFFMFTLVLSVLGFFVPFANTASPRLSRRSRLPLALGAALLTATVMFYFLQTPSVTPGESGTAGMLVSTTFYIGAALLGVPYLLYKVFRQPAELIGPAAEWEPALLQTRRPAPLAGVAYALGILFLPLGVVSCGCCGASFVVWLTTT